MNTSPSQDHELELRCFRVHVPAQAALREILIRLQSSNLESVFYAIRSRVKSAKKVREKVFRKRTDGDEPKPSYEPEDITDVAGIRVVTLFREDVIDALKVFLRLIKHEGGFALNSPFVRNGLKEKIVYTTASVGDPEAITSRLRSAFDAAGFPLKDDDIKQVDTGYSSIHLVAFCSVTLEGETTRVPVEIQIRTVFEDAWGEIDHKLRYSANRGKQAPDALIENWKPHLNVLKTFADGCAQYAGIIKNQAIDVRLRQAEHIEPFIPVDDAVDALAQMGKISCGLRQAFEAAYQKRGEALRKSSSTSPESPDVTQAFLEASDLFMAVHDTAKTEDFESSREKEAALFFTMMERAFCLLSTGKKQFLDEAIKIYSDMQEHSPKSVVVFYRYGQALHDLGELDGAETKYIKAEELLSTDHYVPQEHWLHSVIPRRLGYLTWSRSESCSDDAEGRLERLQLLVAAFKHSERSLAKSKSGTTGYIRSLNNSLYYAIEYLAVLPPEQTPVITPEQTKLLLQAFAKILDVSTATRKQLNWLDTLCLGYEHFGQIEEAVLVAERIEHLLSNPRALENGADLPAVSTAAAYYAVTSHLNQREREVLDHALWVLRKHGPGPEIGRNKAK